MSTNVFAKVLVIYLIVTFIWVVVLAIESKLQVLGLYSILLGYFGRKGLLHYVGNTSGKRVIMGAVAGFTTFVTGYIGTVADAATKYGMDVAKPKSLPTTEAEQVFVQNAKREYFNNTLVGQALQNLFRKK